MKLQTPIEFLKGMQDKIRQDDFETGDEALVQNYLSEVVCAQAISALEKQIPKEPVCYEDKFIHCPCCDEAIGYKWEKYPDVLNAALHNFKYCWECGQKLKWSEEA